MEVKYGDVEITEEQEKELENLLEIKNSKIWKPKENENYYYINSVIEVFDGIWNSHRTDENRYQFGNCFKTKEEAEFRLEQIKVYNELKNFAIENNDVDIDWEDYRDKFSISYNYRIDEFCVYGNVHTQDIGQIYFTSEEIAKKAIEKVGKDRIKKYLFGVGNEK